MITTPKTASDLSNNIFSEQNKQVLFYQTMLDYVKDKQDTLLKHMQDEPVVSD